MVKYLWSGKFDSKSDKWIHMSRKLNEYELMLVERGTLYIGNESETFVVHENEYLIMPPCEYQHGTKAGSCSFQWLHFIPTDSFILPCSLTGKVCALDNVLAIFNLIFRNEQLGHHEVSNQLTQALLLELSYHKENPVASKPDRIKQKIDYYLNWNQEGDLRITNIAHQLGYNEKYLSRLFLAETGQPLKRYLMQHNLEKAKTLLLNTQITIEQIALHCGYSDAHNFTRMIRTELGMSPTEFRKRFEQK